MAPQRTPPSNKVSADCLSLALQRKEKKRMQTPGTAGEVRQGELKAPEKEEKSWRHEAFYNHRSEERKW
jgi:hypothetical protein